MARQGANIHDFSHFLKYVKCAIDMQYAKHQLQTRYDQFGWKDDEQNFLYGEILYSANGKQRITGNHDLQTRCQWVGIRAGSNIDAWKNAANRLFIKGCEAQSLTLLAGFAAPLMKFMDKVEGGAIIHLWSRESARGKTTAAIAAISVWSQFRGCQITNDDTKISKGRIFGGLGNLPIVYDEISLRDPEAIRAFVVMFTNGRDKFRTSRSGELKHDALSWQTIMLSNSNMSIVDMLAGANSTDGAQKRIIELKADTPPEMKAVMGEKLKHTFEANAGIAGDIYLQWLTKPENLAKTKAWLAQAGEEMWKVTRWPDAMRFWIRTLAACRVAGYIVKYELGLLDFDVDRIIQWTIDQAGGSVIRTNEEWAVEAISTFLDEHYNNTIIMPRAFKHGDKDIRPIQEPRGALYIRKEEQPRRYIIALEPLKAWLTTKEWSYREMVKILVDQGVVIARDKRATLGAGSSLAGGQVHCIEIDGSHELMQGVKQAEGGNVIPIESRQPLNR